MWNSFSRRSRSVSPLHKAARPGTRDSGWRCSVALHTASHRLAERNRFAPCYVGPRRSGQPLPPVPSPQVSAESAEPFGLVILAGSNLLRLHFRQRLSSDGPTLTWEGQSNTALLPRQCQSRMDRYLSLQLLCVRLLPRPTALPLCHLCPATATAAIVAASGPKQHRPADERPLQPVC